MLHSLFLSETSKRSDIPRIFKPEDDGSSDETESPQSTDSSESSDTPSSGSGESSTSFGDKEEVKETAESEDESSGEAVKRNIIPTEVFEEGNAYIHFYSKSIFLDLVQITADSLGY